VWRGFFIFRKSEIYEKVMKSFQSLFQAENDKVKGVRQKHKTREEHRNEAPVQPEFAREKGG